MKKRIFIPILIGSIALSICATYFVTQYFVSKAMTAKVDDARRIAFETHYNDRLILFKEENKHANNVDVVFLGDSLTEGYDVQSYYPNYNVLNRGIGGDTTVGVEKRLDVSVFDANPKITAMLIGANNMSTMLDNYENILIKYQEKAPNMKVVLLSLTSMSKEWGRKNELAKSNNIKIKEYADKYGYAFVDLYNPLLDTSKNELKQEYTIDGGHLTAKGYEVVTSVITPVIDNLLGGN